MILPEPAAPTPPLGLIAELTHRCPLQCGYCSNPLALEPRRNELETFEWQRVFDQAAELGVLQLHLTGGEPMARADLDTLVRHAAMAELYVNLITSGMQLDERRMYRLRDAGLDHVQLSFQHVDATEAERIGGVRGAQARKLEAARVIRASGLPLTANFVIHRQNASHVAQMIDLGASIGASRIEIAHTQYYGWALHNRAALMPDRGQVDAATAAVDAGRTTYAGRIQIDYVTPDYHARRPKACMGGWGRQLLNVSPSGRALPCHAAETIGHLVFPSVRERSLASIWRDDPAFNQFRGTTWMKPPCRDCALREIDWGGCRCQALALLGDAAATDPACDLSPHHGIMADAVAARGEQSPNLTYRKAKPAASSP